MINKQVIQERLDKIIKEQEQLKNMLLAYDGAIQESKYWLGQINVEDNAEQPS